jgi:16S rRNA (guanine527-N7)-methyltransferase
MTFEQLPEWQTFVQEFKPDKKQVEQVQTYISLLLEANELFNLTAITDLQNVVAYHLQDSLALTKGIDLQSLSMLADIGTGAGLPGIPIKIIFPHLKVGLLEVNKKKIEFLKSVIAMLELENIEVWDIDWRTFLRKTNYPIDLFTSRASLHTDELMRMFKPSCSYNKSTLIYWASKDWHLSTIEEPFFVKEMAYTVKNRERKLIFFAKR